MIKITVYTNLNKMWSQLKDTKMKDAISNGLKAFVFLSLSMFGLTIPIFILSLLRKVLGI